jgi:kynurenine formamidase
MPRRIIDLSVALEAGIASDPPGHTPEITYIDHRQSAADVVRFFPGLAVEDLPGGEGWAIERLNLSTHTGTHLDAPYHFHSTMEGGQRAWTIDEVPLDWCFGRGVKLDFRHLPDGHVVTAAEVAAAAVARAGFREFQILQQCRDRRAGDGRPDRRHAAPRSGLGPAQRHSQSGGFGAVCRNMAAACAISCSTLSVIRS